MQIPHILSLALLAATTTAVTCLSGAPQPQGDSVHSAHFSSIPAGVFAATLERGYVSYSPATAGTKQGVLQLVNQGAVRRSVCILDDCFWIDANSECKTNKNIDTAYEIRYGTV